VFTPSNAAGRSDGRVLSRDIVCSGALGMARYGGSLELADTP
jgi:hypothetical protein